jgi:hypothetical protein
LRPYVLFKINTYTTLVVTNVRRFFLIFEELSVLVFKTFQNKLRTIAFGSFKNLKKSMVFMKEVPKI